MLMVKKKQCRNGVTCVVLCMPSLATQWQIQGVPFNPPFELVSGAAICGKIAATLTEKTDGLQGTGCSDSINVYFKCKHQKQKSKNA